MPSEYLNTLAAILIYFDINKRDKNLHDEKYLYKTTWGSKQSVQKC